MLGHPATLCDGLSDLIEDSHAVVKQVFTLKTKEGNRA